MTRRQEIEHNENLILAPYACKSQDSLGRDYAEEKDPYRTEFQRDRDRIIHTKAYRRLQGKTQVFLSGEGDHYRNRLTHTNETQQIARDLARSLKLNEDLAESIALAHDLGHTPFGHAGQDALDEVMQKFGKHFEHNQQSKRIVEKLEKKSPAYEGLNLTKEVREGIAKHTSVYDQEGKLQKTNTIEAQIVNIADEIAYYHHDLDDGLRAQLLLKKDLLSLSLLHEAYMSTKGIFNKKPLLSSVINAMIVDIIQETERRIKLCDIQKIEDVHQCSQSIVCFSDDIQPKVKELQQYLYETLYNSPYVKIQAEEGKKIITSLFTYYMEYEEHLPEDEKQAIAQGESKEDIVKDYIAGMTDHFAFDQYKKYFPRRKLKAIQMSLLNV